MTAQAVDCKTGVFLAPIPSDFTAEVIRLHHTAFPPEQTAGTIYACAGAGRYLASLVAFPQFQQEHVLWGAWKGDRLVGYAHFRALPDSWHLNNIAVLPGCQGQGIGRLLWTAFCDAARRRGFRALTLNVDSENRAAVRWYRRQGMHQTGATWRHEAGLRPAPAHEQARRSLRLVGWEEAEAWQALYGFSKFEIAANDRSWTIGRMGERHFKVSQPLPADVESALAQIDSARCLLIFSPEPLMDPGFRLLGKSLWMSGELP